MISNVRVIRMSTTRPIIFWIATFAVATTIVLLLLAR